ncbi:MAG: hypothetical protein KKB22_00615 [Candidatus Omnitrophica bacterium]|nr:hypothetical protein [Candidatus Omnitrophota bacterium]
MGRKTLKSKENTSELVKLANEDLEFIFNRGKGRIFWKGKELTKGLGAYSSMRVKGIWYDSSQAIWKIESREENRFSVYAKWFFLPIYQKWRMEIIKNKILWKIDTKILEGVRPEIEQVNIMAVEGYNKWALSNGITGEFEDSYTKDYDILPFRYCYTSLDDPVINIKGKKLAPLYFRCIEGNGFKTLIENSDHFYKARMIQYQKVNNEVFSPERKFFKGEIKVE